MCGVEFHIIGKSQETSDLPEFRYLKGLTYSDPYNGVETDIDERTRGMAGPLYASCGEENLLKLSQDRYGDGSDVCIHEFAHTIMSTGLDSILRQKIYAQFKQSVSNGLWKGVYESVDPTEYWAELTTWYFGFHGEYAKFGSIYGKNIMKDGPEGLQEYDPDGFKLLDSIYSGTLQPKRLLSRPNMIVPEGIASVSSKQKAIFKVINNEQNEIKLYWINYQAKPIFSRSVAAKSSIKVSTNSLNVWLIEYKEGKIYVQVNESKSKLKFD